MNIIWSSTTFSIIAVFLRRSSVCIYQFAAVRKWFQTNVTRIRIFSVAVRCVRAFSWTFHGTFLSSFRTNTRFSKVRSSAPQPIIIVSCLQIVYVPLLPSCTLNVRQRVFSLNFSMSISFEISKKHSFKVFVYFIIRTIDNAMCCWVEHNAMKYLWTFRFWNFSRNE